MTNEKSYGIIISKKEPYNLLCILDKELGKITAKTSDIKNKIIGSIITYTIRENNSFYKLSEEKIIKTVKCPTLQNVYFLHHYLELIYFLLPQNDPNDKIFQNVLDILNLEKEIDITRQQLIICKFLDELGITNEKTPNLKTINLIREIPIDMNIDLQIDLYTKRDMLNWILEELLYHTKKYNFKTLRFINYFR